MAETGILTEEQARERWPSHFAEDKPAETQPPAPAAAGAPADNNTTPAAETPPAPAPAPAATSDNSTLTPQGIFGEGFGSWDDVKGRISKVTEYEGKVKELETKLQELQPADAYVASLNKALKQGISAENFNRFYHSDPEKITPDQAISLRLQFERGLTKEEADYRVSRKYLLGEHGEGLEPQSPEVRDAQIDMKIDGADALKFLEQYRLEQIIPPGQREAQARIEAFTPVIPTVVKEVATMDLEGFPYAVPEATQQKVLQHLKEMVAVEGIQLSATNPEDVTRLREAAKREVVYLEHQNMLKVLKSEMEKKALADKVNPSSKPAGEKPPTPEKSAYERRQQGIVDLINKSNGMA